MDLIRVDPEQLKRAATEIDELAEGYGGLAEDALKASHNLPDYDGQFGPRVRATCHEAHARLTRSAGLLAELGQELGRIADAFAAADAESAAGFHGLAIDLQRFWDAGLGSLLYNLFRPVHFSEDVWNRLPLDDRIAILQGYGLAFLSPDTGAGTVLYPTNPLRVRGDAGLNADILTYAPAGSELTKTGLTKTAHGVEWIQVQYHDPLRGWITGWVASGWLSDGRSRLGYEPDTVWDRFDVHTDLEVREAGGRLLSVTSNWLEIRDGPTHEYAAPEAIQWGQVVRWTGSYIEEGGHTWYQVIYDDNTQGWARADRVDEFVQKLGAPPAEEGKVWVQVQQERSFSQYNLYDLDSYSTTNREFAASEAIRWKHDIGPQGITDPIEVPYGALFGPDGVAMQGSGVVTVEVVDPVTGKRLDRTVYFTLDNPRDLTWANSSGDHTQWGEGSWTNGRPAEIANPEDARFRPLTAPPELTSEISLAGPPEYRGQTIWVPGLEGTLENNPNALFRVEDAGGAFPPGSLRFDLYFEDADAGRRWYSQFSSQRLAQPIFVQQDIPPEIGVALSP